MSKKKRIKPGKAQSTSKWGTNDSASYSGFAVVRSTGSKQPTSATRQILSKQKPISGNARIDANGWRLPTPFRAYTCKMIPMGSFGYESTSATTAFHFGSSGYCPPNVNTHGIFAGCSGSGHFPRTSVNLENRCITEALNKLKDGEFNAAESLATMNRTVQLIADVATKMMAVYRAINLRNLRARNAFHQAREAYGSLPRSMRNAKTWAELQRSYKAPPQLPPRDWFSKKSAGLWLELQYGWKPLVSDIRFLLANRIDVPPPAISAVRHLEEFGRLPLALGNLTSTPHIHSVSGEIRSGCHVRLDALVTNPGLATLDSLSLVNPFSLGWELLPFSFVIDWLIPIGNAIKALTASCGLTPRGQSVTLYTVMNMDVIWTQYPWNGVGDPIHGRVESLSTYRKANTGFSSPRLYIKSPFTSATRAVTALALLIALR